MSKFQDALKSKGKIKLSEPLADLKRHTKVKNGKVEFTPPPDLEKETASMLQQSVKALNELVDAGLATISDDGKVEMTHG